MLDRARRMDLDLVTDLLRPVPLEVPIRRRPGEVVEWYYSVWKAHQRDTTFPRRGNVGSGALPWAAFDTGVTLPMGGQRSYVSTEETLSELLIYTGHGKVARSS